MPLISEDFLKKNIKLSNVDASGFMNAFLFYAPLVNKDSKIITETSVDIDTAIRIIDYRLMNISNKLLKIKWNDLRNRIFKYDKENHIK